jgi:Aldehyde dehydrogenase family
MINTVDMVSFTGSTETGILVAKQCAARLIPCILELGGKNGLVVCRHSIGDLHKIAKVGPIPIPLGLVSAMTNIFEKIHITLQTLIKNMTVPSAFYTVIYTINYTKPIQLP